MVSKNIPDKLSKADLPSLMLVGPQSAVRSPLYTSELKLKVGVEVYTSISQHSGGLWVLGYPELQSETLPQN